MDSATLTFAALNARIDQLPDHESLSIAPTKRQRWGYVIGFGAGFTGLLAIKLQPDSKAVTIFAMVMIIAEIVGLLIALIPRSPWKRPGFASERREYAEQLDFDMRHEEELVAWLRTFPKERLDAMAQYVTQRHEQLKDKLPLVSGGLEKLGALPVAVALYLQFKDLHWPPHPTWLELILGFALVSLYWASLLLASVRFRAQKLGMLLQRAAESADTTPDHDDGYLAG
jgi:hypothetical protein